MQKLRYIILIKDKAEDQEYFFTSSGIDTRCDTHDAIVDIKVVVMNTEDGKVTNIPLYDDGVESVDHTNDEPLPDRGECSRVRLKRGEYPNKIDSTDQHTNSM